MQLVRPAATHLGSYRDALVRGWSPSSEPDGAAARELRLIDTDPDGFIASMDDPEARGPAIVLPDGSTARRLPGFRRWMWDESFCGTIGLRWQPGTPELPPHCLGHIGYTVVAWKRGRGHATQALQELLPEAGALGLPYVEITTNVDNVASQRVVVAAGGVLVEKFDKPAAYGGKPALRYRIYLSDDDANNAANNANDDGRKRRSQYE